MLPCHGHRTVIDEYGAVVELWLAWGRIDGSSWWAAFDPRRGRVGKMSRLVLRVFFSVSFLQFRILLFH
jgi:hypothetical protein